MSSHKNNKIGTTPLLEGFTRKYTAWKKEAEQ